MTLDRPQRNGLVSHGTLVQLTTLNKRFTAVVRTASEPAFCSVTTVVTDTCYAVRDLLVHWIRLSRCLEVDVGPPTNPECCIRHCNFLSLSEACMFSKARGSSCSVSKACPVLLSLAAGRQHPPGVITAPLLPWSRWRQQS